MCLKWRVYMQLAGRMGRGGGGGILFWESTSGGVYVTCICQHVMWVTVGDSCLCCCCLRGWYLLSASWLPSVLILQLNTVNFVCHFFPHLPQQGVLTGQKSREWKKKLCFTALVAQSIKAKYCSTGSVNQSKQNIVQLEALISTTKILIQIFCKLCPAATIHQTLYHL